MISVSAYLLKGGWPKNLMTLRIPSEYVKTYVVLRDSVAATVGIRILDAQKRSSQSYQYVFRSSIILCKILVGLLELA